MPTILNKNLGFFSAGDVCSNTLAVKQTSSFTATALSVDQINKIWMYQRDQNVDYGTYDANGVLSQNGTTSGFPGGAGQGTSGIAIDETRGFFFVVSQNNDSLTYGTYSTTTGQLTIGGTINGLLSGSRLRRIVVDPVNALWFTGGEATTIAYGTYNTTTGIPTVSGTQSPTGATGVSRVTIDAVNQLLWYQGTPNVQSYNATGILSDTGVTATTLNSGASDDDRSYMIGSTGSGVQLFSHDGAGNLTQLDSLVGSFNNEFDVDSDYAFIFAASGDTISYCE